MERFNRTLLQMLRTTAHDDPQNWPVKLPIITAAYRMTVHSNTNITPDQAMLGREVLLPSTLIAKPPEEPVRLTVPYVKSFRDNLRDAHESVPSQHTRRCENTENLLRPSCERANLCREPICLVVLAETGSATEIP